MNIEKYHNILAFVFSLFVLLFYFLDLEGVSFGHPSPSYPLLIMLLFVFVILLISSDLCLNIFITLSLSMSDA